MDEGTTLNYPAMEVFEALLLVIACSTVAFIVVPVIWAGMSKSGDAAVVPLSDRVVSTLFACLASIVLLVWLPAPSLGAQLLLVGLGISFVYLGTLFWRSRSAAHSKSETRRRRRRTRSRRERAEEGPAMSQAAVAESSPPPTVEHAAESFAGVEVVDLEDLNKSVVEAVFPDFDAGEAEGVSPWSGGSPLPNEPFEPDSMPVARVGVPIAPEPESRTRAEKQRTALDQAVFRQAELELKLQRQSLQLEALREQRDKARRTALDALDKVSEVASDHRRALAALRRERLRYRNLVATSSGKVEQMPERPKLEDASLKFGRSDRAGGGPKG